MTANLAEDRASAKLRAEIEKRFGFLPPIFVPALETPEILEPLWSLTRAGYLDNPIPALLKEKLCAYLGRFSTSPYGLVVHTCSLRAAGMPAAEIRRMLEEPSTRIEADAGSRLARMASVPGSLDAWPEDADLEQGIFACAVSVFLRRAVASVCVAELRRFLAPPLFEQLAMLLNFVRQTHLWAEVHPEVSFAGDGRVAGRIESLLREDPELGDFLRNYDSRISEERAAKEKTLQAEIVRLRSQRVDLEARVQEESTARQREVEVHERFFQLARDLFCIAGPDGRFRVLNAAWERTLGYRTRDLLERPFLDVVHLEDRARTEGELARIRAGGEIASFQNRLLCRDGGVRWMEWTFSVPGAREPLVYGAARDVSERMRAEAERGHLAMQMFEGQKLQAIGRLAAGIAHEINNPLGYILSNLTTIVGYTSDLAALLHAHEQASLGLPDDARAHLGRLRERIDADFLLQDLPEALKDTTSGAEKIRDIVQKLREFTAPERDEPQPADLNELLSNVLGISTGELKRRAEIVRDFGALPPVRCHPQAISQVFLNLVMNASEAMEHRGRIHVSTRLEDGSAVVRIRDEGRGIPPEDLKKMFEPFFSTRPVGKGSGLGLYVAYRIVQGHRGTITATSQVGRGTEFTIRLPAGATG